MKGSNESMLSGVIVPLGVKRLFNGSIRSISTSEWISGCKTVKGRLNVFSWIIEYLTEIQANTGKAP